MHRHIVKLCRAWQDYFMFNERPNLMFHFPLLNKTSRKWNYDHTRNILSITMGAFCLFLLSTIHGNVERIGRRDMPRSSYKLFVAIFCVVPACLLSSLFNLLWHAEVSSNPMLPFRPIWKECSNWCKKSAIFTRKNMNWWGISKTSMALIDHHQQETRWLIIYCIILLYILYKIALLL